MTAPVRALGVVQCRMASTRLPGKALADLGGRPLLVRVLERALACRELDDVVLATTAEAGDDPVARLAGAAGVSVVRGPEDDVLGRYAMVLAERPARCVVRITADNPFTDPDSVDAVVRLLLDRDLDYAYAARIPYGAGADAFRGEDLTWLARTEGDPARREHINRPYLDDHLAWRIGSVPPPPGADRPDVRLTVDTASDLETARKIAARLDNAKTAGLLSVIRAYDSLRT